MKKQLLSLAAMTIMAFGAQAETLEVSLADLGSGWNSSYDPETKTITYEAAWAGRGWWFNEGSQDYSKFDEFVVEFLPVDFDVKAVAEYVGKDPASTEAMAVAGKSKVVCPLSDEGKDHLQQVYLQNSAAGTLTITAAYFQNAEVFDPTANVNLFTGDQAVDWWSAAVLIPMSDLKAARPEVGDKLDITYTVKADGGSIKLVLLKNDWTNDVWEPFKSVEGYNAEYGTVFFPTDGTLSMPLDEAAIASINDPDNMRIMICGDNVNVTKVDLVRKSGSSAITEITTDENAPVEYFNLQGVRVDNPSNGLYIRRQGNEVKKIVIR